MAEVTAPDTVWLRLFGSKVSWYDAGGIRTRAIEAGAGEPVVLLHGITGQAESFARNVIPLSRHFHVLSVDRLGHGLTDKPVDIEYTMERNVRHVVDFIDAAGIKPAHIVGQSRGGWIGSWLAINHPSYVRTLVLDTCAGLRVTATNAEYAGDINKVMDQGMAALKDPSFAGIRKQMERLFAETTPMPDEMVALRQRVFQLADTQRALPKILAASRPDESVVLTPERLAKIRAHTLLIWGRHNRGTSWEEARTAAGMIPNGEFYVVDGAAHWPQWEQPDEFNEVLVRWLSTGTLK